MPLELRYDAGRGIIYVTVDGNVHVDEFDGVTKAIVSSDEYPPNTPTLWDASSVRLKIDEESVQAPGGEKQFLLKLIEMRKRYPARGNAKLAIVVSNDFSFGMSRMYEMLSGGLPQTIMVFRDLAEAEQWLSGA